MSVELIDDLKNLMITAMNELTRALHDGDAKHEPGSWMLETTGNHINHLIDHLRRIQEGEWTDEHGHSHIGHVVCRAAMVAALRTMAESTEHA